MGRKKVSTLRDFGGSRGWLDPINKLPDDAELADSFGDTTRETKTASLVEPYTKQVTDWWQQSVHGTKIHQTLLNNYGFNGSYSSVMRFLQHIESVQPRAKAEKNG